MSPTKIECKSCERLRMAIEEALLDLPKRCICDDAYVSRQLRDPECVYHDFGKYVIEALKKALQEIETDGSDKG